VFLNILNLVRRAAALAEGATYATIAALRSG
jgi:hypothetical protein